MRWHYDRDRSKSLKGLDSLVRDVFLQPDFDIKHFEGFGARAMVALMDKYSSSPVNGDLPFADKRGWIDATVDIPLPRARKRTDEAEAPHLT
ncbi:hypothetical protein V5O48_019636, partial [Marasmius crinis-equi]